MNKKYLAFLRGINVGNIRIKMADLQRAFEQKGFTGVRTYLQTGNVVFLAEQDAPEIKAILEKGLTETFHYEAFVQIYPFEVLAPIIDQYPFERVETHHAYVIFVETEHARQELLALANSLEPTSSEQIVAGPGVVYWQVERGESTNTPFAKITGKAKYKSSSTVRNINTLEKML